MLLVASGSARQMVLDAIESLAKAQLPHVDAARASVQAAIIVRGELGVETNAQIARVLGISIRRLYSERQAALRRLTLLLDQRFCRAIGSATHVTTSLFDIELQQSDVADRSGDPELAVTKLRSLLEWGAPKDQRTAILCRLVDLYARRGSHARAEQTLSVACQQDWPRNGRRQKARQH